MPADQSLVNASPVNNSNGFGGLSHKTIFNGVTDVTVANTVTETSVVPAGGVGSLTIPASTLQVGQKIRIFAAGKAGSTASPTGTLKLYWGATVIATATGTLNVTANTFFSIEGTVTPRQLGATGSVDATLVAWFNSATTVAIAGVPATTTVNTTTANALDLKLTWGAANAANTLTLSEFYVEVIG